MCQDAADHDNISTMVISFRCPITNPSPLFTAKNKVCVVSYLMFKRLRDRTKDQTKANKFVKINTRLEVNQTESLRRGGGPSEIFHPVTRLLNYTYRINQ